MSPKPHLVTVHVAVDCWSGGDPVSTVIGAWSTSDDHPFRNPHEVLDLLRTALGEAYAPASIAVINAMIDLRRTDPNPWAQLELF